MFFVSLIVFAKKNNNDLKKIMLFYFKFCLFLTIFALLFFNISNNRAENQWPIYFGGIHTHSYILVYISIGFSYFIFKKKKTTKLLLFLGITFLLLYIGYGVRTILLVYIIYIITILYVKSNFFKYLWLQILVIAPVIILAGTLLLQSLDINKFSSGRLEMYAKKIEVYKSYNLAEYLLGKGSGSDLLKTKSWWYKEKGSHSDFITFIIENGLIYTVLFIFIIYTILPSYKRVNLVYLSLISGYFLSSLISNGVVGRPLAGYIYFTLLAYIYIDIIKVNNKKILYEN